MKFSSFVRLFGKQRSRRSSSRPRRQSAGRVTPPARKSGLTLEHLEDRTLMSVLPPPTITGQFDLSAPGSQSNTSNESSPQIAVDPGDPNKLFAVYTRHETNVQNPPFITVEARFSGNGGQTWQSVNLPGNLADPTTSNPVIPFTRKTDGSVAFDASHNVYLVYSEHRDDNSAGAVVLNKFNFSGGTPVAVNLTNTIGSVGLQQTKVVYEWAGVDQAVQPTLAVDAGSPSFTDPENPNAATNTQVDPFADNPTTTNVVDGNVYVAWGTVDTAPSGAQNFNPDRINVVLSSDGGNTFSSSQFVDSFGNFGSQRYTAPRLAVSQGTGDGRVNGGQVTAIWDDFGSLATASPPRDVINDSQIGGGISVDRTGQGGIITDAVAPPAGPHIPATTDFPINFAPNDPFILDLQNRIAGGLALTDVDVTLGMTNVNLTELRADLIAPDGVTTVTLFNNQTNAAGNTNTNIGITGNNMGTTTSGVVLGTVFDDDAVRSIRDTAASPFTGHFRPEGFLGVLNGFTAAQVMGTWTLRITDFRNSGTPTNPPVMTGWSLRLAAGLQVGFQQQVTTTTVRGVLLNQPGSFPTAANVSPIGIGPSAVIASDNTLGSFSPNQGRLYLAYVDRSTVQGNPSDNTDVFLMTSDDGGTSWSTPRRLNDDLAIKDGFSEGSDFNSANPTSFISPITGRAQFMPAITVDQLTGTLVVAYLDGRYDAARSRVTTTLATSLDGGTTFSDQVPANAQQLALDAVTGQLVSVGPVPDNQGPGNGNREGTFSFGYEIGLAAAAGHLYPAWSSNSNGGVDGKQRLDIVVAPSVTADGPRVIDSTMGPVKPITVPSNTPGGTTTFNNAFAADGTNIPNGFVVEFDRPINPSTFTKDDVRLSFRTPVTPSTLPGLSLDVTNVTPLDQDNFGRGFGPARADGATRFLVTFDPSKAATVGGTFTGTYSYSIGPNIQDRIRNQTSQVIPAGTTTFNAPANQVNKAIPADAANGDTGGPTAPPAVSQITVSGLTPASIAKVTVNLSINHTFDGDLIIELVGPDGTTVILSNRRGGGGDNFTNTTFDDQSARPIRTGFAPFTGTFSPDQLLSGFNGKDPNGAWRLEIFDVQAGDVGTLVNWSLNITTGTLVQQTQPGNSMDQNANAVAGEDPSAAPIVGLTPGDIYAAPNPKPLQPVVFSGNFYPGPFDPETLPLIVAGPHLVSTQVPGVAASADNLVLGAVTYSNVPAPVTVAPGATVTSPITITDAFSILSATVQLDITDANDPDLTATLIAPNGTRVLLFSGVGTTGSRNFTATVLDDGANTPIASGTAPFTGRFIPQQALAALKGLAANVNGGTWQLEIRNASATNTATLNSWSLTFQRDASVSSIDVVFDRDMDPNTFDVSKVLAIIGPTGPITSAPKTFASGDVVKNIPDASGSPAVVTPLVSVLPVNDSFFTITNLKLQLNITHTSDSDLTAVLVGPDGTQVVLFSKVGGQGPNFQGTVFDDAAGTAIGSGSAPFTGSFRPQQALSAFNGKNIHGLWKLIVTDDTPGGNGTLNSWSLIATPTPITVTANPPGTPAALARRTFRVGFPTQQLNGTYVLSLSQDIKSAAGEPLDSNQNAGLDVLRGTSPTAMTAPAFFQTTTPTAIASAQKVASSFTVTDDFLIQGLTLTLNITYPNDPDLEATLVAPDGTRVPLFTNVGNGGSRVNFTNTVFDDAASTPIQNGQAPFTGRFNPQLPLSSLNNHRSAGVWTLEIKNDSTSNTGTLNSWSLTFTKALPGNGLGEPAADAAALSFRIFNMDPTSAASRDSWTAVGPASINDPALGSHSGRIGGLAVDPSDPSGNTVFVAGASGGVWKTRNFMTTAAIGPTYVPLTDFGPTNAINIGSIAVFGRNNDPNQTIVIAATGEGDTATPGVGFIISMDGGATWNLLDSLDNTPVFSSRQHEFVGMTAFKVIADPHPTPSGEVIFYAAISDPLHTVGSPNYVGGVYRSLDTGRHWTRMRAGDATDVIFDETSGTVDVVSNPTGNLNTIFAAFRGDGVYASPSRGDVWNELLGGIGDPQFLDADRNPPPSIPVGANGSPNTTNPQTPKGRIVLAKPAKVPDSDPNAAVKNIIYSEFLYAFVVTGNSGPGDPRGQTDGIYVTKDLGQNWTKVRIPSLRANGVQEGIPTNDTNQQDYDPVAGSIIPQGQGNYDISLAVDPTNPDIIYVGGSADAGPTGFLRLDITALSDAHSFYQGMDRNDGGTLTINTQDPIPVKNVNNGPPAILLPSTLFPGFFTLSTQPVVNLIQDPNAPFINSPQIFFTNVARFANTGAGARWTAFDLADQTFTATSLPWMGGSTDQHEIITLRDPVTGHARLIVGDDQGVFTVVDRGDGTLVKSLGDVSDLSNDTGDLAIIAGSRNGNLQITQFYSGAIQPSSLSAQIAGALAYGMAQDDGFPTSAPDLLGTGNIMWNPPGDGDGTDVATDQTGTGTIYQSKWPCCGGNITEFFQVNGVPRTHLLVQNSGGPGLTHDPQWPDGPNFNFAVNPLTGNQIVYGSGAGRVFATTNQGRDWQSIGEPQALDGTNTHALAFGAPDPNGPNGGTNLNDFIYAGTDAGRIFVTFTGGNGGGSPTNQWINISQGLDGSGVRAIVTNPSRGSHEAYAVTFQGVYHMVDSAAPNPTWVNVTGNLFSLQHTPFGTPAFVESQLQSLEAVVADWRYVIPDDLSNPAGSKHPVLYVAGDSGVYRSVDNGLTWTLFPHQISSVGDTNPDDGATQEGGLISGVRVTDLDLALGNVNPTTGRPKVSGSPDVLLASTYGRGTFAIRLAPLVFGNTLGLTPAPTGGVIRNLTPAITGLSEQTAFGNTVRIELLDLSDPANPNPPVIGFGTTDQFGRFSVQVSAGYFKADGSTDGLKTLGVRAVDDAGAVGGVVTIQFTLDTHPILTAGSVKLDPAQPAPGGSDTGLSTSDQVTNLRGPFVYGQVDEVATGMLVRLFDKATNQLIGTGTTTAFGNGTTSPNGQFSVQINPSFYTTDGAKTIQVVVSNSATQPANPQRVDFTFVLDTTAPPAPAAPTLAPAADTGKKGDNLTKLPILEFVGTVQPDPNGNTQVDIFADGNTTTPVGTGPANAFSGNYDITLTTPLTEGVHTFRIRQTDVAGNQSALSAAQQVTIDTTPPAAPSVPVMDPNDDTGLSNSDHNTRVKQPHFTVTAEPNSTVTILARNVAGGGGPVPVGTGTADANGNVTIQIVALPDGTYDITAFATDVAGNDGPASSPLQPRLTIDTTVPATPSTPSLLPADDTGASNSDHITRRTTPSFQGTGEPNAQLMLFAQPVAGGNRIQVGQAIVDASGNYTVTAGVTFQDGVYSITVQQVDAAGNSSGLSPAMNPPLTVDTSVVAPTLFLAAASDTGPSSTDHVTDVNNPTFVGQAEAGATVVIFANGNPVGSAAADASGNYAVRITPLPDGTYTVSAQQVDLAGNTSAFSPNLQPALTIDTLSPVTPGAPTLDPSSDAGFSNSDHVTNVRTPVFDGTAEPNSFVTILANGVAVATGQVSPAGTYSVVATVPLADGTYDVRAQTQDAGGNLSPVSAAMQPPLVISTVPPVTPTLTLDPNSDSGTPGDNVTAITPVIIDGTAAPGTLVQVKEGNSVLASFIQDATGAFSVTLNLSEGTHFLTVMTTNVSGSMSSNALKITIDPTALDSDRRFIRALYLQELGRSGNQAEWDYWAQFLALPAGRKVVASGIARSDEARTHLVRGWYQQYLGRQSVGGEEQFWVLAFHLGATEEQVLSQILASREYVNRSPLVASGSNGAPTFASWIQSLYLQLLGHAATDFDVNFWMNEVASQGLPGVVNLILTSVEYRTRTVLGDYSSLLGRTSPPDMNDVNYWVVFGQDLTSIRVGFEAVPEYFFHVTGFQP